MHTGGGQRHAAGGDLEINGGCAMSRLEPLPLPLPRWMCACGPSLLLRNAAEWNSACRSKHRRHGLYLCAAFVPAGPTSAPCAAARACSAGAGCTRCSWGLQASCRWVGGCPPQHNTTLLPGVREASLALGRQSSPAQYLGDSLPACPPACLAACSWGGPP